MRRRRQSRNSDANGLVAELLESEFECEQLGSPRLRSAPTTAATQTSGLVSGRLAKPLHFARADFCSAELGDSCATICPPARPRLQQGRALLGAPSEPRDEQGRSSGARRRIRPIPSAPYRLFMRLAGAADEPGIIGSGFGLVWFSRVVDWFGFCCAPCRCIPLPRSWFSLVLSRGGGGRRLISSLRADSRRPSSSALVIVERTSSSAPTTPTATTV